MAEVFLSHSSADSAAAKAVAQLLRNAGVSVWLDLDQLTPGEQWAPALEKALENSSHFVVLVEESGVQRWVDREVRYALDRNTNNPSYRVIPLLGPGANEKALPVFLRQQQYLRIDWRQPDAAAVQAIAAAILAAPPERVSVLPPGASPFRGLLAFDTEHSHLFFGRDREVDDLLDRLATVRFLPIVGDSGSGKSSLVRAGLIPALLRGRAGMVDWRIAVMKPGEDPLDLLAEAVPQFDPALAPAESLKLIAEAKQHLRGESTTDALSGILAALKLPQSSRQLLVIDQFEQLVTLQQPNNNAKSAVSRFLETVLRAAQRNGSTLQVVITLRADFFGRFHPFPDLWRLMASQHYSVRRMEPDRLREVIVKPMALAGVPLDPGLADTIIQEAGAQPGALALLEHALHQLWRESKGQPPTSVHYNSIGRLKGAIRRHANWVLENRLETAKERDIARRIFIELTALGEGTEDSARRVPQSSLLSLPGGGVEEVLRVLVEERLVTTGVDDDRQMVSIAHEALIREWDTLRAWVDARRSGIRLQRDLQQAAEAWCESRRDPDQLWRGGRLEQAIRWTTQNPGEVSSDVDEFVRTSRDRRLDALARRVAILLLCVVITLALIEPKLRRAWLYLRTDSVTTRVNPIDGLHYVYIPSGDFQMGCAVSDCDLDENPHRVHITRGFWIGQTEVSQEAYERVMKVPNPSRFPGADRPVKNVSWHDANQYCRAVGMRLPSEAEWEYAARAGNTDERYSEIDDIAVHADNSAGTQKICSKWPNRWTLCDMLGNVLEWTNDWYAEDYYKTSPTENPRGPDEGSTKVLRGGSSGSDPRLVRMSFRFKSEPGNRGDDIGFRCAGELR